MMAYKKGKKMEDAIWRLADKELYLIDIMVSNLDTGERFRLRKTTHNLRLARQWRDKQRGKALSGEIRGKNQKQINFENFADEYFKVWSLERKDSTAKREKTRIDNKLKPNFGKKLLHTITQRQIESYIVKRRDGGIAPATTNRELCRIKNMFKKAVEWGYVDTN